MTVEFGRSLNPGKRVFMRRWVDWFTLMVIEKIPSKKTEEGSLFILYTYQRTSMKCMKSVKCCSWSLLFQVNVSHIREFKMASSINQSLDLSSYWQRGDNSM